tara:strand:- start:2892 stop:3203 length:312 start_codon:yes stop_codon:yes gene_type:complete
METITEKTTVKGDKNSTTVNDKVQYLRFWARLIISVLVFGVYFFICWSLFQSSQEELSDSVRSIMQILVGALTVVLASVSGYYFSDPKSDIVESKEETKEEPK